jgi:hypothetical protein
MSKKNLLSCAMKEIFRCFYMPYERFSILLFGKSYYSVHRYTPEFAYVFVRIIYLTKDKECCYIDIKV